MSAADPRQARLVFSHHRPGPTAAQKIARSRPNPPPQWDEVPLLLADAWVLWSPEKGAYWAPDRAGYNASLFMAGVYSERDAAGLADKGRSEPYPLGDELTRAMRGEVREPGPRDYSEGWISPNNGGPRFTSSGGMVLHLLAAGGAS